MEINLH